MTPLLWIHILCSGAGLLFLTLASGVALLYIFEEIQVKNRNPHFRLPSLEKLDHSHIYFMAMGFLLFTLGVGLGFFLVPMTWTHHFQLQQLWTTSGWVVYAFILFLRLKTGLRGKRAALYSLFGFAFVLLFWMVGVFIIFPDHGGWF